MRASLVVLSNAVQRRIPLNPPSVKIGRAKDSDVPLTKEDTHNAELALASVSRNHAMFFFQEGVWRVQDLETKNGTNVNGHKITSDTTLRNGDVIDLCSLSLRFEEDDDDSAIRTFVEDAIPQHTEAST